MKVSIERKTAAGLGLVGLLLLVVSTLAYEAASRFVENSGWVSHTHEVLGELDSTLALLADCETGTRGYVLTGNELYLAPYQDSVPQVRTHLERLKELTNDNPDQQTRLSTLEPQINRVLGLLQQSISVRQGKGLDDTRQFALISQGKPAMDDVRATVAAMKKDEDRLLKARDASFRRSTRVSTIAFAAVVFLELALLGLVYYLVSSDITERKRTERALRESEERFRLVVSGVRDYAIFMLDPAGHVVSWNEGARRIKGYKADEIIGRHFSCFYPSEDRQSQKPERVLEKAIAEGGYEEEGWRLRKDGSRFWANVLLTPLRDQTGALRGFSKITRDATERKRTEQLLLDSEERHRKLFDNNPHPTWVYDRKTLRFLAVNGAAICKYGYSRAEFLAMTIKDIRPPEDVPALLENVRQVKNNEESAGIWRHQLKGGAVIDVEITSYALNFMGRPAEAVVAVDVSQRKRDEAEKQKFMENLAATNQELELRNREVEHATKMKSKFLASMSHELRTPLNAIVGFSGLLAEETAGLLNDKQKRFVGHIKQGADHLLQLINDILDLSKIEAGQLEFRYEDFQVENALSEVLSTIRPLAMAKGLRVQHKVNTEFAVYADRVRCKQILYNLLSNAVKFTPTR